MKIKELTEQQNIYKHYRPLIIFMLIFLVFFFLFPSAFFCTFILHRDKCYVTCDECMFRCFCPFGMKHQIKEKKSEHLMLKSEVSSTLYPQSVFLSFFDHPRRVNRLQSHETAMKPTVAVASLSHAPHRHNTRAHYPIHRVVCLPKSHWCRFCCRCRCRWLAAILRFPSNDFFPSSTILINKILFLI